MRTFLCLKISKYLLEKYRSTASLSVKAIISGVLSLHVEKTCKLEVIAANLMQLKMPNLYG